MEKKTNQTQHIQDLHSKFAIHKESICSLATSLSQGPGFGTAVTIIDMLNQMKQESGEFYLINKNIFDALVKNNEYCRALLDGLQEIVGLLENELLLEEIFFESITQNISEIIEKLSSFFKEKKLNLVYNPSQFNPKILANKEKILLVIEELLINTIKYSQLDSEINLDIIIKNSNLIIQVKNQIHNQLHTNINKEMGRFAKEPFIRFSPPGEENIRILKYGLGLGLTAIEYIVTQHKGEFILNEEFMNYENQTKRFLVAQVNLPILN